MGKKIIVVKEMPIRKMYPEEGECSRFCNYEVINGVEYLTVKYGKKYCRIEVEEFLNNLHRAKQYIK